MPRVRENAKQVSGNERPGKGGMGVYVVDVKFRDLKRRMSFIKEKIEDTHRKRESISSTKIKNCRNDRCFIGRLYQFRENHII